MRYVLMLRGNDTRLLMKIVAVGCRWVTVLLSVRDLIMARRQLLNLSPATPTGWHGAIRDSGWRFVTESSPC